MAPGSIHEPLTLFIRYFRLRLSRHVLWARAWFLYIPRSHLSRPLYFYTVITGAFLALDHSNLSNSGSFSKCRVFFYQVFSVGGSKCLCLLHSLVWSRTWTLYISTSYPLSINSAVSRLAKMPQAGSAPTERTSCSGLIKMSFYSLYIF